MDDNNSRDDRGLKVLLDMWNNDDPRWFSTNEFDDLLANLHALDAMLEASARKPVLWNGLSLLRTPHFKVWPFVS